MAKKEKLTPKQQIFVNEYLLDLNATRSYKAAYPGIKNDATAATCGIRLLRNAKIQAAIQKAMDKRAARTEITQDKVLKEMARLGFANMRNFVTWGPGGVKLKPSDELTEDEAAAVAEVSETITDSSRTIKFKLHDKRGTLELIGRHLKLFNDKLDILANMTFELVLPDDMQQEKE